MSTRSASSSDPPAGWTAVAAISRNGVIGLDGGLPWNQRSDLQRFKALTMGHCLLMGRKTFESIGRALPGRQTLVLTHAARSDWPPGVGAVDGLAGVDAAVEPGRCVMVVGGAEVYRQALPRCEQLWITRILADVAGDTHFPEIDWSQWRLESRQPIVPDPRDDWPSEFERWTRSRRL